MMYVTMYDRDGVPVGETVEGNDNDDAMFDRIERQAKRIKNVCIMWIRDTDGQVAYWGPGGAQLSRYYY